MLGVKVKLVNGYFIFVLLFVIIVNGVIFEFVFDVVGI